MWANSQPNLESVGPGKATRRQVWPPREGEAEVPEIIVVSDAVESTFVDLDGKSRCEQVEAKLSGRERERKKNRRRVVRRLKVLKGK